jgi:hypothetical protein
MLSMLRHASSWLGQVAGSHLSHQTTGRRRNGSEHFITTVICILMMNYDQMQHYDPSRHRGIRVLSLCAGLAAACHGGPSPGRPACYLDSSPGGDSAATVQADLGAVNETVDFLKRFPSRSDAHHDSNVMPSR